MRRTIWILFVACMLFTFMAFAQDTNSNNPGNPASTNSAGQPISNGQQNDASPTGGVSDKTVQSQSKPSDQQTSGTGTPVGSSASSQSTTGTTGSSSDMGASTSGADNTLEGCVVREQTDYFLQPSGAERVRLSGQTQDLASHVGHEVRVHGSEQPNTSASNSSSNTTGTSGSASSSSNTSAQNDQSASGSSNNSASSGSMAGNSSNSSANGTSSNMGNERNFNVTRVDMVSETCPADMQGTGSSNSSSNPK